VDFRKKKRVHAPIHIDGTSAEKLESLKFLGVHITDNLKWYIHTDSVVKKAQQSLFNLRRLKKFGLAPKTLTNFYRCTIEIILSGCITAHNCRALQRFVRSAQCITGGALPALQDTYSTDVTGRPKISSRTTTTRATACSPLKESEKQLLSQGHQIVK
jgi:hypothetical protein